MAESRPEGWGLCERMLKGIQEPQTLSAFREAVPRWHGARLSHLAPGIGMARPLCTAPSLNLSTARLLLSSPSNSILLWQLTMPSPHAHLQDGASRQPAFFKSCSKHGGHRAAPVSARYGRAPSLLRPFLLPPQAHLPCSPTPFLPQPGKTMARILPPCGTG